MISEETREKNFWKRVDKSGDCWVWLGPLRAGYGFLNCNKKRIMAHRLSWIIANNKQIPTGMVICHRCDNRSCVNPAHLFLGTIKDNIVDAITKGRFQSFYDRLNTRGTKNGKSKLTEANVLEIVQLFNAGHTKNSLAAKFSVSRKTIYDIVNGISWNSLTNIPYTQKPRHKRISKLNTEKAGEIKRLYASGSSYSEIGRLFNVSPNSIKEIVLGKLYGNKKQTSTFPIPEWKKNKFWSSTVATESGCLEWAGYLNHDNYGLISYQRKQYKTHRFSWMITNKKEIPRGMVVCHLCDNPKCVKPDHLFLGTTNDNNRDAIIKGRRDPKKRR